MKALVVKGPHNIEWQNIKEPPKPETNEVSIKVKAAGICGTDVHIVHGKHGAVVYPRIPGHELVGEVIAVGEKVTNVKVGDRVAVDPVVSCGKCALCRAGRHNICHEIKCLGVQTEGGFTEIINVKSNRVYTFSPKLSWEVAALVEPFSIAAQISERLRVTSQDKILIVGGGTIGLALLQTLQGVYRAEAIVSDISQKKLDMAKCMSAKAVINPQKEDAVKRAMEIWNNEGPTVIIESVGNSNILQELITNAPPGCRIGIIGFMTEPVKIPPVEITKKELELIGSRMNRDKFPDVLKWFEEGKMEAEKLITHKFKFEEAEKAFKLIDDNSENVCKVILEF